MKTTKEELYRFIEGYMECLLWSSDDKLEDKNPSQELIRQCKKDCINFVILADEKNLLGENDYELAGHDFALTRNGHGSGFWDGDWSIHGDELTELCEKFGETWLYIGDDGLVYSL